ncbi:MAG: VCBS repeat-containing protein [Planctomycetota bacterium]
MQDPRAWLTPPVMTCLAAVCAAQPQFDELAKRHLPVDAGYTRAAVVCDVDGDGDLDAVLGSDFGQPNRLYLNDGAAVFTDVTAAQLPPILDATQSVACCDVDGDSDLDLLFANFRQQNRLLLNDGAGVFTEGTSQLPIDTDASRAIAYGDVDGDGDHDLVVGNLGGQNRLYLNNGAGVFTDATLQLPIETDATEAIDCGDVDGDGDTDLVVANVGQNRLYVNDGSGRFVDRTPYGMPSDTDETAALVCCDVDGDTDLDVIFGNRSSQQDRLYLNDGAGTFTDVTPTQLPAAFGHTYAVTCIDADRDGDADLVFGTITGAQRLHLNNGAGQFSDASSALPQDREDTFAVAGGDLDGDGDDDVLCGNLGQANRLYLSNGQAAFVDASSSGLPADRDRSYSVACGDVDADGDIDLVFGNNFGDQDRLYVNDGSGAFTDVTAAQLPADTARTQAVALCDLDLDGDLDLLLGTVGQNRLYLNNGAGTFSDATATRMPVDGDACITMVTFDADGDGDLDAFFGNGGFPSQNRLYENLGAGFFADVTSGRLPTDTDITQAAAAGDVNGDGSQDLVLGNRYTQNGLYLNNGSGAFVDASATHMPTDVHNTRGTVCCDLDGDGDDDIAFANCIGQNYLYINDGTGRFANVSAAQMPYDFDTTQAVGCGDVDDDGDVDLFFGNAVHQPNRLYLNDGAGRFFDASVERLTDARDNTFAVACCDIDADGDPDLILANELGRNRRYRNLRRQMAAPFLGRLGDSYTIETYLRYNGLTGNFAVPLASPVTAQVPIAPWGILRLDPLSLVALPTLTIPSSGVGSLTYGLPGAPSLLGVNLFSQALFIEGVAVTVFSNLLDDQLTDA